MKAEGGGKITRTEMRNSRRHVGRKVEEEWTLKVRVKLLMKQQQTEVSME